MSVVLDSSVLVAIVKQEPGYERAGAALENGLVSAVVFAEALSKLANLGFNAVAVEARFKRAGLRVVPVGDEDIAGVVALHALAKRSISLADRFCLALALKLGLPCMTGDRPWEALGLPVELRSFR